MSAKAERYAAKQRRAMKRRGDQPKKTPKEKRKEKMRRRREEGWTWGTSYHGFLVRITLPGVDLNVGVSASDPEMAAKLALFENREMLLKKADGAKVRAVVRHPHRGVVADADFAVPEDDGFLPAPKPKKERRKPRATDMSFPGLLAALFRARKSSAEKQARAKDAKFEVKENMPGESFPGIE